MKRLTLTVINDLTYDQRMQRICTSLANAGYDVTLIGRRYSTSLPLVERHFKQKRFACLFSKGKLMYLEFNLRLFFHLFFASVDCICAIDLDTILPVYFVSKLRSKQRVYDAHELFTELKEIVTRPLIHKVWLSVERFAVPKFKHGYTVNSFIANEFKKRYGVNYGIIRNLPQLKPLQKQLKGSEKFIIYQGAVNEGRSFETLIPAMRNVNARLLICGDGNYFDQAKQLILKKNLQHKIEMRGYVQPHELNALTPSAYIAVMLFENTGLNQYYSLANRFFDYVMATVPQVCVGYPEYKAVNDKYNIAYLISDTSEQTIATALNNLLTNNVLYNELKQNCILAREELNWSLEEKQLIEFYRNLFKGY